MRRGKVVARGKVVRRGKVVARGYLVKGMGSPFGDTDCLDICKEMSEGGWRWSAH